MMLINNLQDSLSATVQRRLNRYDIAVLPPLFPDKEVLQYADNCSKKLMECAVGSKLEAWISRYLQIQRVRICRDYMLLKTIVEGKRVTEYGASPYLLSLMLAGSAQSYTCTDMEPDRFNINSMLEIIRLNIESETWSVPKHDVAIFHEIFEHLRMNPVATLEKILDGLEVGGVLSLSTPNIMSLNKLQRLVNRGTLGPDAYSEFKKLEAIGHCGHVREYSLIEICDLLYKVGFRKFEVQFIGSMKNYNAFGGRGKYLPVNTHVLATKTA